MRLCGASGPGCSGRDGRREGRKDSCSGKEGQGQGALPEWKTFPFSFAVNGRSVSGWPPNNKAMNYLSFFLGLAPAVFQTALFLIIFRRKLYYKLRWFSTYTIYSIVATVVRLSMIDMPRLFFISYWITEIIYGSLALFAIYEIFAPVLHAYCVVSRLTLAIPSMSLIVIAVNALWHALFRPFGHGAMARLAAGAYAFTPGILCLETFVFVLCLWSGFRRRYLLQWGRQRAGVLIGFGITAYATIIADIVRRQCGVGLEIIFRYLPAAAYIGATLLWLIAFWDEEPVVPLGKLDLELLKRATKTIQNLAERAENDWRDLSTYTAI